MDHTNNLQLDCGKVLSKFRSHLISWFFVIFENRIRYLRVFYWRHSSQNFRFAPSWNRLANNGWDRSLWLIPLDAHFINNIEIRINTVIFVNVGIGKWRHRNMEFDRLWPFWTKANRQVSCRGFRYCQANAYLFVSLV